jgi:hypothetical protein
MKEVDLLLIYGKYNRNAKASTRLYAQHYPDRFHFSRTYVRKLENSLIKNCSFNRTNAVQQQPRVNQNFNEVINYLTN